MMSINTNVLAATSQNVLRQNARITEKGIERLTSGVRVNSASDNTAHFAMASRMEAYSRSQAQSSRNVNDAISMLQTISATGLKIQDIVFRLGELTLQADTDTMTPSDRAALNVEAFGLLNEWASLANNTRWNGKAMMAQNWADDEFNIGTDAAGLSFSLILRDWRPATNEPSATADISVNGAATPSANPFYNLTLVTADENGTANMIAGDNILHAADRTRMAAKLALSFSGIASELSRIGAYISKIEFAEKSFTDDARLSETSRSKIRDANYAEEVTRYSRSQIISETATALLAQSNNSSQTVMALLS